MSFAGAEASVSGHQRTCLKGKHNWRVIRELDKDFSMLEVINDNGTYRMDDIDMTITRKNEEWYSYQGDDFQSLRGETLWLRGLRRDNWSVETITRTVLTCDTNNFYLGAELDAYEGYKRVFSRNWDRVIPRKLV